VEKEMTYRQASSEELKGIGNQFLDAYKRIRSALDRFIHLVENDPKCARCAASVILYIHYKNGPIYDLHQLDKADFEAAVFILDVSREVQAETYGRIAYGKNADEALEKLKMIVRE
jgi:hypothetical protein